MTVDTAGAMRVISLGAGVQSSAMLLMALEGRFGDMPSCAVFADTGWEPRAVYEWLERLEREVAPFPIHRVSNGNIREQASPRSTDGRRFLTLPAFLEGGGMGRRQCTDEFKLKPLRRFARSFGATAKNPVEVWIGISTDEAQRMKPSRVKYIIHRFPLLDVGMRREECQNYIVKRLGAMAPKSACIGCPFHDDAYWARMRSETPDEFEDACQFDDGIRDAKKRMRLKQYIHPSRIALRDIKEFKHEKQSRMFLDAFGNECEGMCGL